MTELRPRRYALGTDEQRLAERAVLLLKLYLPFDHQELAQKVRQALDTYLRSTGEGKNLLVEGCDEDREYFPLGPAGWAKIHEELAPPWNGPWFLDDLTDEQERHFYIKRQCERFIHLTGEGSETGGYGFSYVSRLPWRHPACTDGESSVVSFSWPIQSLEDHGIEKMRGLAVELASLLPFSSGHVGLAVHAPWGPPGLDLKELLRHPGLDVPHGLTSVGLRVDGVHWLNFLGPAVIGPLAGAAHLRDALHSPGVEVLEMENDRALVALGKWPEVGEPENGRGLPAYREFARVLKPWLYECPGYYSLRGYTHEETRSWWYRFLGIP